MLKKIALVTGANRGIGFEVCRQLAKNHMQVLLGARDKNKGLEAAKKLMHEGLDVTFLELDVTNKSVIEAAAREVQKKFNQLDILINNAGGNFDYGVTPTKSDLNFVRETLELNLFSTWAVSQAFTPLLEKAKSPRIVNVSSGAGSHADPYFGLSTNKGSVAAYGISKLALNGLTVKLAAELKSKNVLVNSVCPGFTATYPEAKAQGARPVEEGAASVVWAALIGDDGPTGGFFRDGQPIGW